MGIGEGKNELDYWMWIIPVKMKRGWEAKIKQNKKQNPGAAQGAQSGVWGWGVLVRVGWPTAGWSGHWVRRSPDSQRATSIHKSAKLCVGVIRKNGVGRDPGLRRLMGESRGHGAHLGSQARHSAVGGQWGTQGCVAAWNGLMSPETSHVTSVLLSVAKKLRKEDRKIGIG